MIKYAIELKKLFTDELTHTHQYYLQEELHHFEHKVTKLEHLQEEHGIVDAKMNQKNLQLSDYPEKQYKLADKVKEYTHKVGIKQYNRRTNQLKHGLCKCEHFV